MDNVISKKDTGIDVLSSSSMLSKVFHINFLVKRRPVMITDNEIRWKNVIGQTKKINFDDIYAIIPESRRFMWFFKIPNLRRIRIIKKAIEIKDDSTMSKSLNKDNKLLPTNQDVEKEKFSHGYCRVEKGPSLTLPVFQQFIHSLMLKGIPADSESLQLLHNKSDKDDCLDHAHIWISNNRIYAINKRGKRRCGSVGNPSLIVFLNKMGSKIYLGYKEWQFEMKGWSNEDTVKLKKSIIECGSKIDATSNAVYENTICFIDIFRPWTWWTKEKISITDEALVYSKRGIKKSESIYLPFEEINFAGRKKHRIMPSTIKVFGIQNIMTVREFSSLALSGIYSALEKHNKRSEQYETFRPSIFGAFWDRVLGRTWLTITQTNAIYKGKILSCTANKRDLQKGKRKINAYLGKNTIYFHAYKKHFYSMRGTIYIVFKIDNIRKDQQRDNSVYELIKMKHIGSWSRSSIRDKLAKMSEFDIDNGDNFIDWKKITKQDYKREK